MEKNDQEYMLNKYSSNIQYYNLLILIKNPNKIHIIKEKKRQESFLIEKLSYSLYVRYFLNSPISRQNIYTYSYKTFKLHILLSIKIELT